MEAVPYHPSRLADWNGVLDRARNGIFLYRRGFMEYHSDRFQDLSFLFLHEGKAAGLVAGHLDGERGWATHRGLTHGGLVVDSEIRTPQIIEMFDALHAALRARGIEHVRYKPLPWWLQSRPSQEDLWVLARLGAKREAVWLNTLVPLGDHQKVSSLRKRGAARAKQAGIEVSQGDHWEGFWNILAQRLAERHGVKPVHSLDEIRLLASRFPERIQLWCALEQGQVRAGIVGFLFGSTLHVQYSAASDRGRESGALDLTALSLLSPPHETCMFLSFGTSCEDGGRILNDGLLAWKEGFGGHGSVYEELSYQVPSSDIATISDTAHA